MEDSWKPIARVAGYVLGAAALAPVAYFGLRFVVPARCPECDADLHIVKRPGAWDPDLEPASDWD